MPPSATADRILVAGATGYLGRRLVSRLVARGLTVRALVRGGAARAAALLELAGAEIAEGHLGDPDSLERALGGCRTVVHLIGILRERGLQSFEAVHVGGTTALVQAARASWCERILYVSALGARLDSFSAYARTKAEAEELVRRSGLSWLVLRPSIVLAREGEFYGILRRLVSFPIVPVLGPGTSLLQPIVADDLAAIEVQAMFRPAVWNRAYDVAGPRAYPFVELVRATARGLGRPAFLVHVPLVLARPAAALAAWALTDPPITPGELRLLEEGGTCDPEPAARAFGVTLQPIDGVLGATPRP